MVFVMISINYLFSVLTVTILVILITTTNTPSFLSVFQNKVYATTQQQQEDSSSENNDSSPDANEGSETTHENVDPEQSEGSNGEQNSNDEDGNDSSSSDQSNTCPDTNDFADVPTYVGQDGCQYPCISPNNNGQGNIPQSCPVELPSQSSSGFSINEERPIQSQSQPQTTEEPQQNTQTNPSQNTFVSPKIGSDTTSNIPTSETTSTTQKSLNPAGQFKPGSGQTESNIPLLSNDFSKPFTPGAGNAQVEGIGLAYLTVYPNFTYTGPVEICIFTSHPYEVKANPYCIEPYSDGTFHALQAPGLIGIRVSGNADTVDTSNCEFYIYPKQSKSCILNNLDSPFLKSKSETGSQDRVRAPIE
jgi:hypothetical protein